jgi:hypothetical protein
MGPVFKTLNQRLAERTKLVKLFKLSKEMVMEPVPNLETNPKS